MKLLSFKNKRDIYRIHLSQTIRSVALSIISVYIPIYLLELGYSLPRTIVFFIALHSIGLLYTLLFIPSLIKKWGLIPVLKSYYPLQIAFFASLHFLSVAPSLYWILALLGGIASFSFYIPLNMLLLKNAEYEKMGSDMANFFAFPKAFGIIGPLISAALIPIIGFWPVFMVVIFGLIFSYLPLAGIRNREIAQSFDFRLSSIWTKLKGRKLLFVLEGFDNIMEESEWFWGIFVFLIIGTLNAPGIVGSLEALGGAVFTVIVGRYANKSAKALVPIASVGLIISWIVRLFIRGALSAYVITVIASFTMTFFLVTYFSMIYRAVKGNQEEEFIILREIPTVIGRMIVFGTILLTISNPRFFFVLPILATVVLLGIFLLYRKRLGT